MRLRRELPIPTSSALAAGPMEESRPISLLPRPSASRQQFQEPVALVASFYGHDHYQRDYEIELGHPWDHKEVWDRISPFYRVADITTPTLFMGGDIDWNVPILGSEQMYEAMKTLGRTTELVVYPGEYHGFTVPSHIKDRMERFMAWYNHYVKGDSVPARPAQPEIKTAGGE
jgi:pimeloyl-ACP methyl ester carboxylesterase